MEQDFQWNKMNGKNFIAVSVIQDCNGTEIQLFDTSKLKGVDLTNFEVTVASSGQKADILFLNEDDKILLLDKEVNSHHEEKLLKGETLIIAPIKTFHDNSLEGIKMKSKSILEKIAPVVDNLLLVDLKIQQLRHKGIKLGVEELRMERDRITDELADILGLDESKQ